MITKWLLSNKTLTILNISECKFSVKGTSYTLLDITIATLDLFGWYEPTELSTCVD